MKDLKALAETIRSKSHNSGDGTKETRARKGAYVDCVVMLEEHMELLDFKIESRVKELKEEKEDVLAAYMTEAGCQQEVLAERNMRISIEMKFLKTLLD